MRNLDYLCLNMQELFHCQVLAMPVKGRPYRTFLDLSEAILNCGSCYKSELCACTGNIKEEDQVWMT